MFAVCFQSANGVYINDVKIPANIYQQIKESDVIGIGAPKNIFAEKREFFMLKRSICKEDSLLPQKDSNQESKY